MTSRFGWTCRTGGRSTQRCWAPGLSTTVPWCRPGAEPGGVPGVGGVWLARHGMHITAFHTARSPLYIALLVARSPRGGWRVVAVIARWVLDREQAPIREGAIQRGAVAEYLHLSRLRKERVKQRAPRVAVLVTLLSIGVTFVVSVTPSWISAVCGVSIIHAGEWSAHHLTGGCGTWRWCPRWPRPGSPRTRSPRRCGRSGAPR